MKVDGPQPRNQAPRLDRQRVHHDERVHPAAVRRPDQQVAAFGQVLLSRGPIRNRKTHEDHEPRRPAAAARYVQLRAGFGRPAEPREALGRAAARVGQRLAARPGRGGRRRPVPAPAGRRPSPGAGRLRLGPPPRRRRLGGAGRPRRRRSSASASSSVLVCPRLTPSGGTRSRRGSTGRRWRPRSPPPGRSAGRRRLAGRDAATSG